MKRSSSNKSVLGMPSPGWTSGLSYSRGGQVHRRLSGKAHAFLAKIGALTRTSEALSFLVQRLTINLRDWSASFGSFDENRVGEQGYVQAKLAFRLRPSVRARLTVSLGGKGHAQADTESPRRQTSVFVRDDSS